MSARAQWAWYGAMLAACALMAAAFFSAWNGNSAAAAPPDGPAGDDAVSSLDGCRIEARRIELHGWAVMKNAVGQTRTYVTLLGADGHPSVEIPVRTLPRPDVLRFLGLQGRPVMPGFAAGRRLRSDASGAARQIRIRIVDQAGRSVEARHAC